jgi:hypothetical protein
MKDDQLLYLKLEADEISFFVTSLNSVMEFDTFVLEPDISELESDVSALEFGASAQESAMDSNTSALESAHALELDTDASTLELALDMNIAVQKFGTSTLETDSLSQQSNTSSLASDTSPLGFTVEELLIILINLSTREGLCSLSNNDILVAVEKILQGDNRHLQGLAIHLLLNFTFLRANLALPENIVSMIRVLQDDLSTGMGPLACCLLQSMHQDGKRNCFCKHTIV